MKSDEEIDELAATGEKGPSTRHEQGSTDEIECTLIGRSGCLRNGVSTDGATRSVATPRHTL
jgi:hypothetical protein